MMPKAMSKVSDLVSTIDRLMQQGTAHINVLTNDDREGISVHEQKPGCAVSGACCQPTENIEEIRKEYNNGKPTTGT